MNSLEICVESLDSALAAERGGAQRVELCSALSEGGLTPSLGLIRAVRSRLTIGLHVLIRPRSGDFFYSQEEFAMMREDIVIAAAAGAKGVVLGLLTESSDVDVARTRELVTLAAPLEVTFHRAFDMARDLDGALEDVIRTGAVRLLTSGGEASAMQGRHRLRQLVEAARGRVEVMVGGGLRRETLPVVARTVRGELPDAAVAFHASLRRSVASPVRHQVRTVHLGDADFDDYTRSVVYAEDVAALRAAIEEALSSTRTQSGVARGD